MEGRNSSKTPRVNGVPISLDGHTHTEVTPLVADSRLMAAGPTSYPLGTSWMPSYDDATPGTFAAEWDYGVIETTRWDEGATERCTQFLKAQDGGSFVYWRTWVAGSPGWWSAWQTVNKWADLTGKPSTFPPSSHTHTEVTPLATDTNALAAPPTDYPVGLSVMASDAWGTAGTFANWYGETLGVQTHRWLSPGHANEVMAVQFAQGPDSSRPFHRFWDWDSDIWSAWYGGGVAWGEISGKPSTFPPSAHTHTEVTPLAENTHAESAATTAFPLGISIMPVSAAANWGPNTGEAGTVAITRTAQGTYQTFQPHNSSSFYYRTWSGSAWNAWVDLAASGSSSADASTTTKGITKLSSAPASATDPIAVGDNDTRMTNARTPTSHATSHVTGGSDVIASAVPSGNAGLMTGSDKAKLDGISAGAQVNLARHHMMRFFEGGELSAKTGVAPDPVIDAGTIDKLECRVGTAPVGQDIIVTFVEVDSGGATTTIGTVTITAGNVGGSNTSVSHAVVETDAVRCDITQVGTTTKGSNLVAAARQTY